MYSENSDHFQHGEKTFEPTPIELRKQYNTLDSIIRARSTKLQEENSKTTEANSDKEEDGFLPPFNSAF
jgi:hypothetical protein